MRFTTGDILESHCEALVNTVNTEGVMGKGIALQFRTAFPYNYKVYKQACAEGSLQVGKLLTVEDRTLFGGSKIIINFPTKTTWKQKSRYEYIEVGLLALRTLLQDNSRSIANIAIPPLGAGNGGLDWTKVKALIIQHLGDLTLDIVVFEPAIEFATNTAAKPATERDLKSKLTVPRAMLLRSLYAYEELGEQASLFAANKLAYFLQRFGEPMKLTFIKHYYGPYDIRVQKVLNHLNGYFLRGLESEDLKAFETITLSYDHRGTEYCRRILEGESIYGAKR